MDIAVVDDEKAIREHICGLVEEQRPESRIEKCIAHLFTTFIRDSSYSV